MSAVPSDPLRDIIIGLFQLPANSDPSVLTQSCIPQWDSFATVQIIMEVQNAFGIELDLDELEKVNSYSVLREIVAGKGCLPGEEKVK